MSWLLLATLGQFINALVAILDKYIVTDEKVLPKPFIYAFYSCLLTGGWIVIYLFGFVPGLTEVGMPHLGNVTVPSIEVLAMAFLSAYTFFIALVSMYSALRDSEAVSVMPVIGAISSLSAFLMSYLFLDTSLTLNFVWGVIVLSLGTLLVAQTLPAWDNVLHVVHSGIFFALHYVTMKGLFLATGFDDGFFWSRVAFVLFALSLLLVPTYLKKIREQSGQTTKKAGALVLVAKILAGIGAFLLLKATDMGEVAVVQALDGIKFVFILIISIFFGALLPDSAVKTETRPSEVVRRVLYVAVIVVGYFILFL